MKTIRIAALAGAVALVACSESPTDNALKPNFSNNGAQQSVTGHVERDLSFAGISDEKYSFSAVRRPDGSVVGQFEVHDPYDAGGMDRVTGHVTCFTIAADGKTAYVGGIIDSSTNPAVPAGMGAIWSVRDNGEGHGVADAASDLSWGWWASTAQAQCDFAFYHISGLSLRGNVQVRP